MAYVEVEFSDLEFYEKLGGGAAGSVYRGKWKKKIVAIKKLLVLETEVSLRVGWPTSPRLVPQYRPRS
jgi:hypothetical protein